MELLQVLLTAPKLLSSDEFRLAVGFSLTGSFCIASAIFLYCLLPPDQKPVKYSLLLFGISMLFGTVSMILGYLFWEDVKWTVVTSVLGAALLPSGFHRLVERGNKVLLKKIGTL